METPNINTPKPAADKAKEAPKPATPATPVKVPPLFRPLDWIVMGLTFLIVWAVYLYTLAPELTLEDSGELCTGSYYAGIPHPPGYPFWAIYSWLWTVIVPFGNVAWRVEVGESFAAAMGCGFVAIMVSRGSSMLIEGIEELKSVTKQWETAICSISGLVAGLLIGFDGYVWGESVAINRISLFAVPWLALVVLMLMRWAYTPGQRRYLYIAMLCYGICATIHQTLLLSAMGVEVVIALVQPKLGRDLFVFNSLAYIGGLMCMSSIPAMQNMSSIETALFHIVGVSSIVAGGWLCVKTEGIGSEWLTLIFMGVFWAIGVSFYFYEPIAGMTVPPMQWGYPRTVEGFFHALSRGQYESVHGTNLFQDPTRFANQIWYIVLGLSQSFSWVFMFIGTLPFLFLGRMHKRERSWILGLTSIYLCLSVLLVILLDVTLDRSSADLNEVFFTASHMLFAIIIGMGLTILAAYMATHYANFRKWGLLGGSAAIILALYCLNDAAGKLFFGPAGTVGFFSLPHWVAQAFAPHQYGLPVIANLVLLLIPLIFVGALLVYRNRGPVVIVLGLFLAMPIYSSLSHWYKSEQRDHWFGYWFGHDMFTPPFGIYPEMTRDAILFGGTDPGRFCPTYMVFCESFTPHNCQPKEDQKFDRRDVYVITQNALADGTYLCYLRSQYNRSQQIDPPFFSEFIKYCLSFPLGQDNGAVNSLADAAYHILDVPFTSLGAAVEKRRRAEGVYPPKEIYIPSPSDSEQSFKDYTEDVARRQAIGQLKPGEDVHIDNGRVSVSGQVAVMMINGLLCRTIFDHNPTNEFFVEESFPLDWMYPYESPFGIIMKINREPLSELSEDVLKKDNKFWSKYSERLCGNWITYDTSVKDITAFIEKTYINNNLEGFNGNPRFLRDDDGQKAFSKLRSSIAGMYAWRLSPQCPAEFRQKSDATQKALIRETDFAFKQSFAFCPYSPEAVFRYVNFLLQFGRFDDALLVAQTCQKLDPFNGTITDLIKNLNDYKKQSAGAQQVSSQLDQLQAAVQKDPTNAHNAVMLGVAYLQTGQNDKAVELFDRVLNNPSAGYNEVGAIANYLAQMNNWPKLESALTRLTVIAPTQPEARYDLAALQAILNKTPDALKNLKQALDMNAQRLHQDPKASNLAATNRTDARFNALRNLPEYQKLISAY